MVFRNSKEEEILNLELRNRVYKLVVRFAGSHLREIERKSEIPYSTLKYHLHYLVKHGLIIEKRGDKSSRYYPKAVESKDLEILGLLRQKNMRRALLFLAVEGDCNLGDLENFMGLSPSTVSWYLDKLIKKEFVSKKRDGRRTSYKLNYNKKELMRILISYKESFLDGLVDKAVDMWELR